MVSDCVVMLYMNCTV